MKPRFSWRFGTHGSLRAAVASIYEDRLLLRPRPRPLKIELLEDRRLLAILAGLAPSIPENHLDLVEDDPVVGAFIAPEAELDAPGFDGEIRGNKWEDVLVDLRVEDHPDPVVELSRLLQLHRGYEMMNAGDLAVEEGNVRGADHFYGEAERILAGNLEAKYWHAVALTNAGQVDKALNLFGEVFVQGENWRELTPRLVSSGFLEVDTRTLERIMTVVPVREPAERTK